MHGEAGNFLVQILILLGCSSLLITLFNRLRIAPLLSYILVGIIFGPTGLKLVSDPEDLSTLGELGLTFLLFILGLEFSLPRLIALRKTVFQLGGTQVGLCTAAFFIVFTLWGLPWASALIISGGLSLSSTAIVSRELSNLNRLKTRHGEISIGVLLFQDLAAVALLIAVPLLSSNEDINFSTMLLPLAEGIVLLTIFFFTARYLLPVLLREITIQKSDDLLVLSTLVIVLLAATLTSSIGLSMELGAFLVGMMLGETRYRHQLEADVRPFRDLLLGLFFITIGMIVDIDMLKIYWLRILVSGLLLLVFKATIISLVARFTGESWRSALPAGMSLSQGGEFLFALMALATRDGLVPHDVASFLISITIVSMMLTPMIIRYSPLWVDSALLRINRNILIEKDEHQSISEHHASGHVLILGFGRVGQSIARFLKPLGIEYLVLETDDIRISEASIAGEPVFYGDSSRLDILKAAGAEKAKVVVISFDNADIAATILNHLKGLNPDLPVLARTRDDTHLDKLIGLGATEVIPETHEASLTLTSHLLLMLNIPSRQIHTMIDDARHNRYHMLHGFYHGERVGRLDKERNSEILHAVRLTGMAWACNKEVSDLKIPSSAELVEIHRGGDTFIKEQFGSVTLLRGDVLLLQGAMDEIDQAEAYLLRG